MKKGQPSAENPEQVAILEAELRSTSEAFRTAASAGYATLTDNPKPEASLPYQPPKASAVTRQLMSLEDRYNTWADKGWEPVLFFVPPGMHQQDWEALLKSRQPSYIGSDGITFDRELPDSVKDWPVSSGWAVGVASGTQIPPFTYVSANGNGYNANKAVRGLREAYGYPDDLDPTEVIRRSSPDSVAYCALRFALLRRSLPQIDPREPLQVVSTILSERFTVPVGAAETPRPRTIQASLSIVGISVSLFMGHPDYSHPLTGVRPTAVVK